MWLNRRNWCDTSITLIDKAKLPLATIDKLLSNGHLSLSHNVKLIHSDIRDFRQSEKSRVTLADILNPYIGSRIAVPKLSQTSPYEPYEHFLKHIKEI